MVDGLRLRAVDWATVLSDSSAWERVRQQAPTETVFLTPEWLEPWWRHLKPRGQLALLVLAEGSQVEALAPLYRGSIGPAGLRAIRLLGGGVGDYLDLLLPPSADRRQECLGTLIDGLLGRSAGWDAIDLLNVPYESPTVEEITRVARDRGLHAVALSGYARPGIALVGSWEQYLKSRPGRFRYNLRSRLRRLAQLGDVEFRTLTRTEEVGSGLEELTRLHARRWAGQRTSTIFSSSARGRAFYAEACRRYASRALMDLTLMQVGGRTAAACLGLVNRQTYYYYMPAWEPTLAPYAPATLLVAHLIERAFSQGLQRFDFMIGDEPYKQQWATEARQTVRLLLAGRGAAGRTAFEALRAWHGVRGRARTSRILQRVRRYGLASLARPRAWHDDALSAG